MSLKKDKQKVLGEVFDNERIMTFLDFEPPAGTTKDFHLLEKAYRGMKAENFDTFLTLFKDANYDINAKNPNGHSILAIIEHHKQSKDYEEILKKHGAQI